MKSWYFFLTALFTMACLTQNSNGFDFDSTHKASIKLPSNKRTDPVFSVLSEDSVKNVNLRVMKTLNNTFSDSCLQTCKRTKGCVRVIHCLGNNPCALELCVFSGVGNGICYLMGSEGVPFKYEAECKISNTENSVLSIKFTEDSKKHEKKKPMQLQPPNFHLDPFHNVKLPGASQEGRSVPPECLKEPSYLNQGAVRKRRTHKPGYPMVIEYECGQQGHGIYKYVTGTTEALCDEDGRWTLPALICIPTNCYMNAPNSRNKQRAWYAGAANRDKNGHECQNWTDNAPHSHDIKHQRFSLYPGDEDVVDAGNKCRDFATGVPWCYTMDHDTRWDYCEVPVCEEVIKCGLPPHVTGARPIRTQITEATVQVSYVCQEKLTYHSGKTSASCDKETGIWTWPDMICYSKDCFYYDLGLWNRVLYNGDVSTTVGDKECQRYDSVVPHNHDISKLSVIPPEISLQEIGNKCRGVDSWGSPWCYTTDPNKQWDYCDIPECVFR